MTSSGWSEVALGDVADVSWGNTSTTKKAYVDAGFRAYSASGPDGFVDWAEHHHPGVVLSAIGAQCGKTWWAEGSWTCIKNTIWFRSRCSEVESRFLFYATSDPGIWPKRGAAQPFISQGDARALRLRLPSLSVQRRVVGVLSAIDDLVENNRRRIEILEEMARLVYREWFVHFRFPGREDVELVESNLGLIPDCWEVRALSDVLELAYGKALKANDRRGGDVAVYGSGGIVGWHDEALVDGPGIVVGRKGNVGTVYWSDCDFYPIDTTYFVKTEVPLSFVYQQLRTLEFIDSHAAVPGLSREQAYGLKVVLPADGVLDRFHEIVTPMYELRRNLLFQVTVLKGARELLLPLLISGELDVSDFDLDLEPVA